MTLVSCKDLADLMAGKADRVAVLILLRDAPGQPEGEIQFVTYGKKAADKVEAHHLKEWLVREVFSGERPQGTTHESFLLDAAINRERIDAAIALTDTGTTAFREAFPQGTEFPPGWCVVEKIREVLTGGNG